MKVVGYSNNAKYGSLVLIDDKRMPFKTPRNPYFDSIMGKEEIPNIIIYVQKCINCGRIEDSRELLEHVIWKEKPLDFVHFETLTKLPEYYKTIYHNIVEVFSIPQFSLGLAHSTCPSCQLGRQDLLTKTIETLVDKLDKKQQKTLYPKCHQCSCWMAKVVDGYQCEECHQHIPISNVNLECPKCHGGLNPENGELYCFNCHLYWTEETPKKG